MRKFSCLKKLRKFQCKDFDLLKNKKKQTI